MPQQAYFTTPICVAILISNFSHLLGDNITAQRIPSNTPAEASTENNITHPVYSTKYSPLMGPKW